MPSKIIPFHNNREWLEVSGIIYHCEYCPNTYIEDFIHGSTYLPIGADGVEYQKKLRIEFGKKGNYFRRDCCVCQDCLPNIPDYKEILKFSRVLLERNDIVTSSTMKILKLINPITEILTKKAHNLVDAVDFSTFPLFDSDGNKVRVQSREFFNACFEQLAPLMETQINNRQIKRLMHIIKWIYRKDKKRYDKYIVRKGLNKGGEHFFFNYCMPMTAIDMQEYILRTGDLSIINAMEVEKKPNPFKLLCKTNLDEQSFPKLIPDLHLGAMNILSEVIKEKQLFNREKAN